jgi:hypothetical protein
VVHWQGRGGRRPEQRGLAAAGVGWASCPPASRRTTTATTGTRPCC